MVLRGRELRGFGPPRCFRGLQERSEALLEPHLVGGLFIVTTLATLSPDKLFVNRVKDFRSGNPRRCGAVPHWGALQPPPNRGGSTALRDQLLVTAARFFLQSGQSRPCSNPSGLSRLGTPSVFRRRVSLPKLPPPLAGPTWSSQEALPFRYQPPRQGGTARRRREIRVSLAPTLLSRIDSGLATARAASRVRHPVAAKQVRTRLGPTCVVISVVRPAERSLIGPANPDSIPRNSTPSPRFEVPNTSSITTTRERQEMLSFQMAAKV